MRWILDVKGNQVAKWNRKYGKRGHKVECKCASPKSDCCLGTLYSTQRLFFAAFKCIFFNQHTQCVISVSPSFQHSKSFVMDCNSALNYLKNTPCSAWDFALIVDAIKATNQCSDENAFTALDTILKKNFSAAQTSSFTANWKKMIDSYKKEHKEEITKQTGPKERLYKQLVQTQMNIGSLNTLNNTNTNIINKKKRKLSNPLYVFILEQVYSIDQYLFYSIHGDTSAQPAQSRTSFTPSSSSKPATTTHARNDRRTTARNSFEELFDESDQEGDEETCLDAEVSRESKTKCSLANNLAI